MEFDNLEAVVTIWTIRISVACLFASLGLRLLNPVADNGGSGNLQSEPAIMVGAKHLWLLGSFFSLLHALAAMGFYHQWSHALAFADTARQTRKLLGVGVGIGIYFNYTFVLVWLIDAMWWIGGPRSYAARKRWISWLIYGFLVFIAINGTIVFEGGVVRWISVVALVILSLLAIRKFVRLNGSVTEVET